MANRYYDDVIINKINNQNAKSAVNIEYVSGAIVADLVNLQTDHKGSWSSAINEVKDDISAALDALNGEVI